MDMIASRLRSHMISPLPPPTPPHLVTLATGRLTWSTPSSTAWLTSKGEKFCRLDSRLIVPFFDPHVLAHWLVKAVCGRGGKTSSIRGGRRPESGPLLDDYFHQCLTKFIYIDIIFIMWFIFLRTFHLSSCDSFFYEHLIHQTFHRYMICITRSQKALIHFSTHFFLLVALLSDHLIYCNFPSYCVVCLCTYFFLPWDTLKKWWEITLYIHIIGGLPVGFERYLWNPSFTTLDIRALAQILICTVFARVPAWLSSSYIVKLGCNKHY
jgi:hypothetical protein